MVCRTTSRRASHKCINNVTGHIAHAVKHVYRTLQRFLFLRPIEKYDPKCKPIDSRIGESRFVENLLSASCLISGGILRILHTPQFATFSNGRSTFKIQNFFHNELFTDIIL